MPSNSLITCHCFFNHFADLPMRSYIHSCCDYSSHSWLTLARLSCSIYHSWWIMMYIMLKWLVFSTSHYLAKARGMGLLWKFHNLNFNRFWLMHPCDRRTDGWAIAYSASLCKHICLSHAIKLPTVFHCWMKRIVSPNFYGQTSYK